MVEQGIVANDLNRDKVWLNRGNNWQDIDEIGLTQGCKRYSWNMLRQRCKGRGAVKGNDMRKKWVPNIWV